jgi:hypothetical protein
LVSVTPNPVPTPTTPKEQFVAWMQEAGEVTRTAVFDAHVLEDYIGPFPKQAGRSVADATRAVELVNRSLDLGYLDSDDAGSFASSAVEQLEAGIAALRPVVDMKPAFGEVDDTIAAALGEAKQHFLNANGWITESIDAM